VALFGIESNLAVPVVGILLAAISGLGIMAATAAIGTDTGTDAVAKYRAELERTNGVIGEGIRNQAAKAVADSDGAAAAKALGISTSDLTDYILNTGDAQQRLNGVLSAAAGASSDAAHGITAYGSGARVTSQESQGLLHNVNAVEDLLRTQTGSLGQAKTQWDAYREAQGGAKGATDAQTQAIQLQANVFGVSVGMYQTATASQQSAALQLAQTTANMVQQNDAAGLLKQAWDALNGKTLSLEQAQTRAAGATNSVTQAFQQNGLAIDGGTTAAVANQTALQNKVAADQAAAEAIAKSTGKTQDGTKAYGDSKVALENSMRAQGLLTDDVQRYIDKLYDVNNLKVNPTKLEVDSAAALADIETFKWHLANIQNRIVTVTEQTIKDPGGMGSSIGGRENGSLAGGVATGGLIHSGFSAASPAYLAEGGSPFVPRGTDTVPAMLTPGEIVMKRASVNSLGAGNLLHANRTGQWPGGGGDIAAAIREGLAGATITVQNPFTGEQVRGLVVGVVTESIDGVARQIGGMRR
jgi:hypothetical protein